MSQMLVYHIIIVLTTHLKQITNELNFYHVLIDLFLFLKKKEGNLNFLRDKNIRIFITIDLQLYAIITFFTQFTKLCLAAVFF